MEKYHYTRNLVPMVPSISSAGSARNIPKNVQFMTLQGMPSNIPAYRESQTLTSENYRPMNTKGPTTENYSNGVEGSYFQGFSQQQYDNTGAYETQRYPEGSTGGAGLTCKYTSNVAGWIGVL